MEHSTETIPTLFFRKAYPNPAQDILKIDFLTSHRFLDKIIIKLYDYYGSSVFTGKLNNVNYNMQDGSATGTISIDGLENGLYILEIDNSDMKKYSKIIILR